MIGAVGHSHPVHGNEGAGPGNRANSVGHQAKAAVAAAREAGADLPKNAQGLAASSIARGVEAEAIFAGLIAPEEPAFDDTDDGVAVAPLGDDGEDAVANAETVSDEAPAALVPPAEDEAPNEGELLAPVAEPVAPSSASAEDIALALLEEAAAA